MFEKTMMRTSIAAALRKWGAILIVLRLTASDVHAQTLTVLASFDGNNGQLPDGSLTLSGDTLYGTTWMGSSYDMGRVFSIPASGGAITTLASLNQNSGFAPHTSLLLIGNSLYGTAEMEGNAGHGAGTVFSVPVGGGSPTVLGLFTNKNGAGASPYAGLTLGGGTFYGTTLQGGAYGYGTVFSLPVSGGTPTVLATFDNGAIGGNPVSGLTLIGNTLYGTTNQGGAYGYGTVFSLPVGGGIPTVLTSFNSSNGDGPCGDLTLIGNTFYGTTYQGGAYGCGTVFSLPVSGGNPTVLASFNGSNGRDLRAGVTLIGNTLYGTAQDGGAYGYGTIFSVPLGGGAPTVLVSFNGSNGENPQTPLTPSGSILYGAAYHGGAYGYGTVFALNVAYSTWATAVNGSWSSADNWTGGVPNAVGAWAVINTPTTAALTITLDAPQTLGTLLLGNPATAGVGYTLSSTGSNTLTLNNSGGGATITVSDGAHAINAPLVLNDNLTVSNSSSLTIGGAIANGSNGAMGITVSGGLLVLAGSNTYSGNTTISGGTVTLAHPLAVQNSTVNATNSGTLSFAAGNTSPTLGGLTGAGNVPLATAAAEPVMLNVGNNGQSTAYNGSLSGAGGLTKQGAGILTLTAPSTYSGPTVIAGGAVKLQAPVVGGSIGVHFEGNGGSGSNNLAANGSGAPGATMNNWMNLSATSFTNPTALTDNSGANTTATFTINYSGAGWNTGSSIPLLNGYLYIIGGSTFTLNVSGIPYSNYSLYAYAGAFESGTSGRESQVTLGGATYYVSADQVPSGYTQVTNTSSYAVGDFELATGLSGANQTVQVYAVNSNAAINGFEIVNTGPAVVNILPATTALSIAANSALDLSGGSQQVASLGDYSPGSGGRIINSGTAASVLTLSPTSGSTTFSGMIQGGGALGTISLVMSGSGTQALSGSNSYTGGTTIKAGTLQVAGTASLPGYSTAGKITVASGGVLAVSAGGSGWTPANIASLLAANGSRFASGSTLGVDTTGGSLSYGLNIAGSMGLTKLGTNTLALTGSSTYTGPTTISQGKLVLDGYLTNSAVSVSGGTLGGTGYLTSGTVNARGHLSPGDSLGVLHFSGNLVLTAGAAMDYDLGMPGSGDELQVSGLATLNGTLNVNLWSGYWPSEGDSFDLISGATTGNFAQINLPALSNGMYWNTSNLYTSGTINVVPEPSTLALLGVGVVGMMGWAWRRRGAKTIVRLLFGSALLASAVSARADPPINVFNMPNGQTSLQFVTVGDPGNVADTIVMATDGTTGYGSVPYVYQMGKYDVTLGQYTAFLNAVATTSDPYGLYHSNIRTDFGAQGIGQSGGPGSYTYSVIGSNPQAANCPVFDVSWGDAARFCNWLRNGQPTGTEGNGTTETGAYTLGGDTTNLMTETRNAGATYFIPSEDEWYKAAFYSGGGTNSAYYTYPTKSNLAPNNSLVLAPTSTNDANYYSGSYTDRTNFLTPVGTFAASPGPYGTFDMGGDVWQWNEAYFYSWRSIRGASWADGSSTAMASSYRGSRQPSDEMKRIGFRVASVPEPGSIALLLAAAVGLLAFAWRRRRQPVV